MYGIFEYRNGAWKLWHLAPSPTVAEEVRRALAAFTRDRYYVYGPGYSSPPPTFPIVGYRSTGMRVTWGNATSEWHAWHVRDALAQWLWNYQLNTGKRSNVDPYSIAYVTPKGRTEVTQVSQPWNL